MERDDSARLAGCLVTRAAGRLGANAVCLLLSLGVSAILAEGILALAGDRPYYGTAVGSPGAAQLDPLCRVESIQDAVAQGLMRGRLGALKPDVDLGYTYYPSRSNPQGFAESKDLKRSPQGITRVLVLGDSFTAGASADRGKGYVDLLNEHYRERGVVFFNTGVGGYGQNNQLAVLRKHIDGIKPHLVLLGLYPGNDLKDNLTPIERYTAFDGQWVNNYELVVSPHSATVRRRDQAEILGIYKKSLGCASIGPRELNAGTWLRDRVAFRTRVGTRLWLLKRSAKSTLISLFRKKPGGPIGGFGDDEIQRQATRRYLEQIRALARSRGAPTWVVAIPDNHESGTRLSKSRSYRAAIELLEDMKIPYVDVFEDLELQDYVSRSEGGGNDHWNNSGHRKAFLRIVAAFDDQIEKPGALALGVFPGVPQAAAQAGALEPPPILRF
jgi:hypothetical protein